MLRFLTVTLFFEKVENIHTFSFTFDCKLYTENSSADFFQTYINTIKLKFYGISISTEHFSKEQIVIANVQNLRVTLWHTITNKDNEEAIKKNTDYIQSDR